jgi:hypothetical protein
MHDRSDTSLNARAVCRGHLWPLRSSRPRKESVVIEHNRFRRHEQIKPELLELRRTHDPSVDDAVDAVLDEFLGVVDHGHEYFQYETSGRSCFLPLPSGVVINVKGVGHGPGTDRMWENVLTKCRTAGLADEITIVRLPWSSAFPVDGMALIDVARKRITFQEVLLAGLAELEECIREFVASKHIYDELGIAAVRSLALLRHDTGLSWAIGVDQPTQCDLLQDGFRELLSNSDAVYRGFEVATPKAHFVSGNGALLVRCAAADVRLQDVYIQALRGQWGELRQAFTEWGCLSGDRRLDRTDGIIDVLADSAARMMNSGVVHGQLHHHLQNVCVPSGELCDFDFTIVSPYHAAEFARIARSTLDQYGRRFQVDAVDAFDGLTRFMTPSRTAAAATLLEQSFSLRNFGMRFIDLVERVARGGTTTPGTVLTPDELDLLELRFARRMAAGLDEVGRSVIAEAQLPPAGEKYVFTTFVGRTSIDGWTSTFGWSSVSRPFNGYEHVCTEDDARYVSREYRSFVLMSRAAAGFRPTSLPSQ